MLSFSQQLAFYRKSIEDGLAAYLEESPVAGSEDLLKAMRYSVLGGGKRVRGTLVLAFSELLGADVEAALPAACAVEMLHSYTLIHDDLPCMDDDVLRRGKPSCHIAFGEATALLAGDALLTLSFEVLSRPSKLCKRIQLGCVLSLAKASGYQGVIGGQVLDLRAEKVAVSEKELHLLHQLKTASLIASSAEMGCLVADAPPHLREMGIAYGQHVGFAFQVQDDILDVCGKEESLGKPVGSDEKNEKTTYVSLLGVKGAKKRAKEASEDALCCLSQFPGNRLFLEMFTQHLLSREN